MTSTPAAAPPAQPGQTSSPLPRQITGFAGAGVLGFLVDAGLTLLFSQAGLLSPVWARIPATAAAVAVTFLINRHVTFRSRDPDVRREFVRYVGVSLGGALVNYLCFALIVTWAAASKAVGLPAAAIVLLAVTLGSAAAAAFNFLGSRHFAFARGARGDRRG